MGLIIGILMAILIWRHMRRQIADLRALLRTSVGELVARRGQR
jgi:hypothetical protein